MRERDKELVAICISDLHLSSKPPVFRSCEEDWIGVQRKYLRQVKKLCQGNPGFSTSLLGTVFSLNAEPVPLLIPGDLFDKPLASPEVITLAIEELPKKTFAVMGNHDAPAHRYEDMKKSAYGTLVAAGTITDIKPGEPVVLDSTKTPLRLHGFPCGYPLQPLVKPSDFYLEIAVAHSYIWTTATGYEDAPEEQKLASYKKALRGYDVALFGDNHKPFHYKPGDSGHGSVSCEVYNLGSFLIRKSDERGIEPRAALIYSDGSMETHYLDTSQDKYLEVDEVLKTVEQLVDSGELMGELLSLSDQALDFAAFLRRVAESSGVSEGVKKLILQTLNKGD